MRTAAKVPIGPVEKATRAHCRRLCADAPFPVGSSASAAAAVDLAARLDALAAVPTAAPKAAALSKALLDAVGRLTQEVGGERDVWAEELSKLSAQVRDGAQA